MSPENSPAAASSAPEAVPFELGLWLGRHQALAWVANCCSAADAHALRLIREKKLYRSLGITWEDFCRDHAGFSHKKADRIIGNLNEFGDDYFHLTAILQIPTPEYRAIQPAIRDSSLQLDGHPIPINRENTQALIDAVRTLRDRLQKEQEKGPIWYLQAELDRVVGRVGAAIRRDTDPNHDLLILMVEDHARRVIDAARHALDEAA